MRFRAQAAATLAVLSISAFLPPAADAQFGNIASGFVAGNRATPRVAQRMAYQQPDPRGSAAGAQNLPPSRLSNPSHGTAPAPMSDGGEGYYVDGPMMEGGEYYPQEFDGAYYGGGDCCSTCGGYGGGCSCICPPGWQMFPSGRFYATADYLYVRANFSEGISYLIHDPNLAPEFRDEFRGLDFQYESSFRVGGGYLMDCCDEQIRFLFTRFSSFAEDFTDDPLATGPFETTPGPGGSLEVWADVDAISYDLEYAKTIRLGGQASGCGCGESCGAGWSDPCSCGTGCGSCGPCCPEWAITWSGGFRFADVDWQRSYVSFNPQLNETRSALSRMDFRGGGPKFGLEGRRFFGPSRCMSAFLKGDISLLLGDVDLEIRRVVSDGTPSTPDTVQVQAARFRNIIPVTEIEAGLSVDVAAGLRLSSGYLFSAWHDLGFRDQFDFATFLETGYDDANILGFDGFFARLEASY